MFVIGFCFFVGLNSLQIVPDMIRDALILLSSWCLVTAIAALGVSTSLKDMTNIGYQPLLLVLLETVFIASWVLLGESFFLS